MLIKDHYLTRAVFFVKDREQGGNEVVIDCSVGGDCGSKAVIRKLCVCGSPVTFDENQMVWLCSDSGTDLGIPPLNHEPLVTPKTAPCNLSYSIDNLQHPDHSSIVTFDEKDHVQVFTKVPKDRLWIISDPLLVNDFLHIKPFQTDLLVVWRLMIGDIFTGELDTVEVLLNIADSSHEKTLELLASGSGVDLHFLDGETLSVIGSKRLNPIPGASDILEQIRYRVLRLPKEPREREVALQELALAQEVSAMSFAARMGMCTQVAVWLRSGRCPEPEFNDHLKVCESCKRLLQDHKSE